MNWFGFLLFLEGVIIGFLLFVLMVGYKTGQKPKHGIAIQIYLKNGNCIHIHHWIIFSMVIFIITLTVFVSRCRITYPIIFILGVCTGIVIQGLTYSDAFKIRTKCFEQYLSTDHLHTQKLNAVK